MKRKYLKQDICLKKKDKTIQWYNNEISKNPKSYKKIHNKMILETVTNENDKERYTSPEERQKISII